MAFSSGMLLLALGWFVVGFWQAAVLVIVLLLVGLFLLLRGVAWGVDALLVLGFLVAGGRVWAGMNLLLVGGTAQPPSTFGGAMIIGDAPMLVGDAPMLVGVVAVGMLLLAGWDLFYFSRYMASIAPEDSPEQVEMAHLRALGLVLLAGAGVDMFAFLVHIQAGFEWTLVLVGLSIAGAAVFVNAARSGQPQ